MNTAIFILTLNSDDYAENAERLVIQASGTNNAGDTIQEEAILSVRKSQSSIAANIFEVLREIKTEEENEEPEDSVDEITGGITTTITEESLLQCPDGYDCEDIVEDPTGTAKDRKGKIIDRTDEQVVTLRLLEGRLEQIEGVDDSLVWVEVTLRLCGLQLTPAPCPSFGNDGFESRDDIVFQHKGRVLTPNSNNEFTVRFMVDEEPVITATAKSDTLLERRELFSLTVIDEQVSREALDFFDIVQGRQNRLLMRIPANDGTIALGAQQVDENAGELSCATAATVLPSGPYELDVTEVASGEGDRVAIVVHIEPTAPPGGITLPFSLVATPKTGRYKLNSDEYTIITPEFCTADGGKITTKTGINPSKTRDKNEDTRNIISQDAENLELFFPWLTKRAVILVEIRPDTIADFEESLEVVAKPTGNFYRPKTSNNERAKVVIAENDNGINVNLINHASNVTEGVKFDTFGINTAFLGGYPKDSGGSHVDELIAFKVQKKLDESADGEYEELDLDDVSQPFLSGIQYTEKALSADKETLYLLFPHAPSAADITRSLLFTLKDPDAFTANEETFTIEITPLDDRSGASLGASGSAKTNTASPYKPITEKEELKIDPFSNLLSITTKDAVKGTDDTNPTIEIAEPDSGTSEVKITLTLDDTALDPTSDIRIVLRLRETGEVQRATDLDVDTSKSGASGAYDSTGGEVNLTLRDFRTVGETRQAFFYHQVKADDFAERDESVTYAPQYILDKGGGRTETLDFDAAAAITIKTPANDNMMRLRLLDAGGTAIASNTATVTEAVSGTAETSYTAEVILDHGPEPGITAITRLLIGDTPSEVSAGRGAKKGKDYDFRRVADVSGGSLVASNDNKHELTLTAASDGSYKAAINFKIKHGSDGDAISERFNIKAVPLKAGNIYVREGNDILITIDDKDN